MGRKLLTMFVALVCIVTVCGVANSKVTYQVTIENEIIQGEAELVSENGSGETLSMKILNIDPNNTWSKMPLSLQLMYTLMTLSGAVTAKDVAIKVTTNSAGDVWIPVDVQKAYPMQNGGFKVDYVKAVWTHVSAKAIVPGKEGPSATMLTAILYLNANDTAFPTTSPVQYKDEIRLSLTGSNQQPFSTQNTNQHPAHTEILVQLDGSYWILDIKRQLLSSNSAFVAVILEKKVAQWVLKTNYDSEDKFGYVVCQKDDLMKWLRIPVTNSRLHLSSLGLFSRKNSALSFEQGTLAVGFTNSAIALEQGDLFEPAKLTWIPIWVTRVTWKGNATAQINYIEPTVLQVHLLFVKNGNVVTQEQLPSSITTVNIWKYSTSNDFEKKIVDFGQFSGNIILEWNDIPTNFIGLNTPGIIYLSSTPDKPETFRRFVGTEIFIGKDKKVVGNVLATQFWLDPRQLQAEAEANFKINNEHKQDDVATANNSDSKQVLPQDLATTISTPIATTNNSEMTVKLLFVRDAAGPVEDRLSIVRDVSVKIWKHGDSADCGWSVADFDSFNGQIKLEWSGIPENFIGEKACSLIFLSTSPKNPALWRRFVGTELVAEDKLIGNIVSTKLYLWILPKFLGDSRILVEMKIDEVNWTITIDAHAKGLPYSLKNDKDDTETHDWIPYIRNYEKHGIGIIREWPTQSTQKTSWIEIGVAKVKLPGFYGYIKSRWSKPAVITYNYLIAK